MTATDRMVVPHEGTWIEIIMQMNAEEAAKGRSPRGNVD